QGMRDYQSVLDAQPDNPAALTGYAAVLVASDQSSLVARAAVMLAKAEQADASYAPAYAYLGRALVLLGDYRSALPQLRTFLRDQPTGPLSGEVGKLLAYAEQRAGAAGG
ncbi:MAG: tetratricopeptide repeat protein, partial [Acidimicrobiales bacterium]